MTKRNIIEEGIEEELEIEVGSDIDAPVEAQVEMPVKKDYIKKESDEGGKRVFRNISGELVSIGFLNRTVVWKVQERVPLTKDEYESKVFKNRINKFKEVI